MGECEADSFAAIITDPPYGCQHGASGFKDETNFNMMNPAEIDDLGNSRSYDEYYARMRDFGQAAYRVLQPGRYLVMLIGDRYHQGEYLPLGYRIKSCCHALSRPYSRINPNRSSSGSSGIFVKSGGSGTFGLLIILSAPT